MPIDVFRFPAFPAIKGLLHMDQHDESALHSANQKGLSSTSHIDPKDARSHAFLEPAKDTEHSYSIVYEGF